MKNEKGITYVDYSTNKNWHPSYSMHHHYDGASHYNVTPGESFVSGDVQPDCGCLGSHIPPFRQVLHTVRKRVRFSLPAVASMFVYQDSSSITGGMSETLKLDTGIVSS